MNDLQKILAMLGVVIFILAGVATLFFLFAGIALGGGEQIAVVNLKGEITSEASASTISASVLKPIFEDLAKDESVVAVVLNIDSGGGAVVETKEILRAVEKLKEQKPVVAYIGDIGASAAYYIAAYTDFIIADEDSLIGSIGVISTYTVYQNLLEEKLGINTTVIKSGEFKDMGSPYRQMTEEEKARMQVIVDTVYSEFISAVVEKRALSPAAIDKVKTGDIFLGSESARLGLIDSTGGIDDAVAVARQMANSPDAKPYYVDKSGYYDSDLYYSIGKGVGDSLAAKLDIGKGSLQFSK